jgi:hypothetical protein
MNNQNNNKGHILRANMNTEKDKHNSKGQAAMEFLMTYGWAILIVLAAMGALSYFGVLTPDKFLTDKCLISNGFNCPQFKISPVQIQFEIKNTQGVDLSGIDITLYGRLGNTTCIVANPTIPSMATGATTGLLTFNCPVSGDRFTGDINIVYTRSGETISHNASGSITAKVE